MHIYNSVVYT